MKKHPIQEYREARGLLLREAAKLLGVSVPTVWQWENGKRRISPARLVKLEKKTGIPREDLRPDLYRRDQRHAATTD